MGSHFSAPVKLRSERTTRGILALLLVVGVLAAITITGTGIANAGVLTGYYSPRIGAGGVDINNDGLVNESDDSTGFLLTTDLIDGHLNCDGWGTAEANVNAGGGGDSQIDDADDCILRGYVGTASSGSVSTETYVWVIDGYFAYTSTSFLGSKSVIADGFKMPSVFDKDATSFNFGSTTYSGIDWVWRLKDGKVDYNWDNTLTDNVTDYLFTVDAVVNIRAGLVDVDDSGTVDGDDDCFTGCFFGQDVSNGYVQDNTPVDRFAAATGPAGPAGTNGVSGRVAISDSSSTNSLNKSKSATCSGTTKVLGGGYTLTGTTDTLKHLTVVANGPAGGTAWRVRVIEATPTSGTWAVTVTAICATA